MKTPLVIFLTLGLYFLSFSQDKPQELELVKLGKKVNSRYHDTAPLISPDGKTLYFFVTNHPENTYGTKNSQDIWFCKKDSTGNWTKAQHMPAPLNKNRFNQVMSVSTNGESLLVRGGDGKNKKGFSMAYRTSDTWSVQPIHVKDYAKMNIGRFSGGFLSHDGNVLVMYFSEKEHSKYSNLYVSFKESEGVFSKPSPLPDNINTSVDEFGPFITTDDKTMYFASNRSGGLGSMDIYKTTRLDDSWKKWSEPENIGAPVNTSGFDAYYSVDASRKNAFTTRTYMSRDGGSMDILGIIPKKIAPAKILLSGTVFNEKTKAPITANISYESSNQQALLSTEEEGFYEVLIEDAGKYKLEATAEGYLNATDSITVFKPKQDTIIFKDFYLKPIEVGLKVRLEKIYFDFDKTTLRPESYNELDKLVLLMEENSKMVIEIGGHTDGKGTERYNEILSQGRAEAVMNYLKENWIPSHRISAMGYGESMPEATNETDEGRQYNRRVEFVVMGN